MLGTRRIRPLKKLDAFAGCFRNKTASHYNSADSKGEVDHGCKYVIYGRNKTAS